MTTGLSQAQARDGGQCRVCGGTYNLHMHHLKYRSKLGKDDANNYLTLCEVCHEKEHSHRIKLHVYILDNNLEVFVENIK